MRYKKELDLFFSSKNVAGGIENLRLKWKEVVNSGKYILDWKKLKCQIFCFIKKMSLKTWDHLILFDSWVASRENKIHVLLNIYWDLEKISIPVQFPIELGSFRLD